MNSEHCCHICNNDSQSMISNFDKLSLASNNYQSDFLLLPPALPKISFLSPSIRFYCQHCQIICCENCVSHQTHQLVPIDQAIKFEKVRILTLSAHSSSNVSRHD